MWWMAIPALVGAFAGLAATAQQAEQERAALAKQKETAWDQYELGKGHSDAQYAIQRGEAQFQAARAQQRLDQGVDMSIEQMNTSLLAQAIGIQDAQIMAASNAGASLAAEGAGGTRGNAANELARAYEARGLERNINLQNRQNEQALAGLVARANNSMADIIRERDSWDPGGYRYKSKEAQDAYNRDIAELGQTNFDWQIRQAEPTGLDNVTAFLQGGSSGMNMANSMYQFDNAYDVSGGVKNAWNDFFKKKGGAA
jgi:hypothetical protein